MGLLNLLGRISLDSSPFHASLRGVSMAASKTGSELKNNLLGGLGPAAVIAAGGLAIRSVVNYADSMEELSERLRTGTTSAQEWNLAARLNGEEAAFVAQNFQKMEKALIAASAGDDKAAKSLRALGIEASEFKTIKVDDAMRRLVDPTAKFGTESERSAGMLQIFSKSASKLSVVLNDLEKSTFLTKLGAFADENAIRNVKNYADAWATVGTVLKGIGAEKLSPGNILSVLASGSLAGGSFATLLTAAGLPGFINRKLSGTKAIGGDGSTREGEDVRKEIETIADRARTLQEKNRISQLSDEERLNELIKEREEIFNRITVTAAERAKKELDIAENESEIIGIKRREASGVKSDSTSSRTSVLSDSLTAIGNFLGGSTNSPQVQQMNRQTELLQRIERNTGRKAEDIFPI